MEQHWQIKTLATFEGMSMKDYILSKVLSPKEKKPDATELLMKDPKNREQILKALDTPEEKYISFDTLEDLKDALKI